MSGPRILVGGEALVDLVPTGSGTGSGLGDLAPRLGGGPFTVAVALGRLGVPVSFRSRISTDAFGDALLAHLHESGVDTALVQRGPEPTTLAVVTRVADGSARYSFYVEGTADRFVTDLSPVPADVAAISLGTVSLLLEPGASVYEAILHRSARAGLLTVLDPNVRESLISDVGAFRARFRSWLPSIGILKLSIDDAEWLAGSADVDAALDDWLRHGPLAVVLTRGADGIEVRTASAQVSVPSPPVVVADTIGAGDTVHAALLAWLHRRDALSRAAVAALDADAWRDLLDFAARAAAHTVSRVGADPPWPSAL